MASENQIITTRPGSRAPRRTPTTLPASPPIAEVRRAATKASAKTMTITSVEEMVHFFVQNLVIAVASRGAETWRPPTAAGALSVLLSNGVYSPFGSVIFVLCTLLVMV